jgi:hypothetical protein
MLIVIFNEDNITKFWRAFKTYNLLDEPKHLQDNFSDVHERNGCSKFSKFRIKHFRTEDFFTEFSNNGLSTDRHC